MSSNSVHYLSLPGMLTFQVSMNYSSIMHGIHCYCQFSGYWYDIFFVKTVSRCPHLPIISPCFSGFVTLLLECTAQANIDTYSAVNKENLEECQKGLKGRALRVQTDIYCPISAKKNWSELIEGQKTTTFEEAMKTISGKQRASNVSDGPITRRDRTRTCKCGMQPTNVCRLPPGQYSVTIHNWECIWKASKNRFTFFALLFRNS